MTFDLLYCTQDTPENNTLRWKPREYVQAEPSPGLAAQQEVAQLGLFAALKLASDRDLQRSGWTQLYRQRKAAFALQQKSMGNAVHAATTARHSGRASGTKATMAPTAATPAPTPPSSGSAAKRRLQPLQEGWNVAPLLRSHGLGHYARQFTEHEIDFEAFQLLTESDLDKLGA